MNSYTLVSSASNFGIQKHSLYIILAYEKRIQSISLSHHHISLFFLSQPDTNLPYRTLISLDQSQFVLIHTNTWTVSFCLYPWANTSCLQPLSNRCILECNIAEPFALFSLYQSNIEQILSLLHKEAFLSRV